VVSFPYLPELPSGRPITYTLSNMADEISGVPITTHESNAAELVRSLIVVTALSVVFMSLRFYCKTRYSKNFGIDDGLLAFSWVSIYGHTPLPDKPLTFHPSAYRVGLLTMLCCPRIYVDYIRVGYSLLRS
jgi:hypothetical protein